MKVCFMCDLHLPFDRNALQYNILDWAIEDIKKKHNLIIDKTYVSTLTTRGESAIS